MDSRKTRDIVVLGGSAGSLAPLRTILSRLRPDLPAAVLVVRHSSPEHTDAPQGIAEKDAALPLASATDGEPILPGQVRFAIADHHMMLEPDRIILRRGPRENLARPSIDALFRSAAVHHPGRVISVLMSGHLNDGAAGTAAVRRCGGLASVEDPAGAKVPEMPNAALEATSPDYTGDPAGIAEFINDHAGEASDWSSEVPRDLRIEASMAAGAGLSIANETRLGELTEIACPQCGGNLWEMEDESRLRFRCHTGHAFTAEALEEAQGRDLERAIWSALRALRERAALLRRMARDTRERRTALAMADRYSRSAEELEQEANTLQAFLCAPRVHAVRPPEAPEIARI